MAFVTRPGAVAVDKVTADEFLAGPERPGVLLLDGEVFVNDATHLHQRLCGRVYNALLDWTRADGGHGSIGWGGNWVLSPTTVVKPDVWWMASGPGSGARYDGPPDIAVEVLSPAHATSTSAASATITETPGSPELWLVDARSLTVVAVRFSRGDDAEFDEGDSVTSPQLPGFTLPIDDLFAPP